MTHRGLRVVLLGILTLHLPGHASRAEPPPIYPWSTPSIRCVLEACNNIQLVDFSLRRFDADGNVAVGTRLRLRDWGFLGVEVDRTHQTLNLTTARWGFDLRRDDRSEGLGAEYRARRLRLRSSAQRETQSANAGWLTQGELALRVSSDFELIIGALKDARKNPLTADLERPVSTASIGGRWQPSSHFELFAQFADSTLETLSGSRLDRKTYAFDSVFLAGAWRFETGLEYQDLTGRFARREGALQLRADYRVGGHTVIHLAARKKDDVNFGAIAQEAEAGITFFARKHSYDRSGRAAQSTVALHRRAFELGLNETRGYSLEERRRLRERLALSKHRAQLAGLIDSLYRAQVADRNVPLAGLTWNQREDNLDGSRTTTIGLFWSIPWSKERSLGIDQSAVEFLRFSIASTERDISSGFRVQGKRLGLDIALNRELRIEFAWEDPIFTGLDFALDRNLADRFEVGLVYHYGI